MDELGGKIGAMLNPAACNWWSPEEIAEEIGEPKDRIEAIKAVLERMLDSPVWLKKSGTQHRVSIRAFRT